MGKATAAITVLSLATATGCAMGIPLDANMRIAIDAPNAPKYSQNGAGLDPADMRNKLRREVEAGPYIKTAESLQTASTALSIVGSLVAAWPIGYVIATDTDPEWVGLGISVGTLTTGLILLGIEEVYVEKAARAHNAFVLDWSRETAERTQRIAAKRAIESLPRLPEGFGFDFDAGLEEAETRCKSNGYEWSATESGFSCSGVPLSASPRGLSELTFVDEHMATLRISVHPRDDAGHWATAISKMEQVMTRMYGAPNEKKFTIPSDCISEAFMGCVKDGRMKGRLIWSEVPKRSVTMEVVNTPPYPRLVVEIKRVTETEE